MKVKKAIVVSRQEGYRISGGKTIVLKQLPEKSSVHLTKGPRQKRINIKSKNLENAAHSPHPFINSWSIQFWNRVIKLVFHVIAVSCTLSFCCFGKKRPNIP
jgi:hypothetical protein